jgi:anhydro-N-acetylmuramic acid kinase
MASLETDGERILAFGPAAEKKLDGAVRAEIERAIIAAQGWRTGEAAPAAFAPASRAVTAAHLAAAQAFFRESGLAGADFDLAGAHGQTVLHEPPGPGRAVGRSIQLIDAEALARGLGLPVVFDFRSADLAAGGQGAPLAPVYHRALVSWSKLPAPVAVLNLGGVANVTFVGPDGALAAFDTGPANGMLDLLVQARTSQRCDEDGAMARAGVVDEPALAGYLDHPYFRKTGPRSLDRFAFPLDPVAALSTVDAAATLTAFAAEAVAIGLRSAPEPPRRVVICGGGRMNSFLMEQIAARVGAPLQAAESVGWRGDAVEAEAFAYLAARTWRGLPISYPATTGVAAPLAGGRIVRA